tara:strand:- start:2300 stop:2539 length:240 start_codon:yes stop_codon:yes gene_type:complete
MTPNFNNEDLILTTKLLINLKVNDVVILDDPKYGVVLKRIHFLKNDQIKVTGDNKEYYSGTYDRIYKKSNIIGKVLYKF